MKAALRVPTRFTFTAAVTQLTLSRATTHPTINGSLSNPPGASNHALARAVALHAPAGAVAERTRLRLNARGASGHCPVLPLHPKIKHVPRDQLTQDGVALEFGS